MPAISLLIKPARIRSLAFFASSSLGASRRVLVKSLLCRIIAPLYRKPAADTADGGFRCCSGRGQADSLQMMRANIVCPHRQVRIFALRKSGSMRSRPPALLPHTILRVIEMVLSHHLRHFEHRRPHSSITRATCSPTLFVLAAFSIMGSLHIPPIYGLLSFRLSSLSKRIPLYSKYIN